MWQICNDVIPTCTLETCGTLHITFAKLHVAPLPPCGDESSFCDDQWVTDIFIIHLRKYVCWQNCAEFRIVYCVFLAGGISARLKITKDWWGLMRFACLMPQGSGGQLTSRQLENLSQQPWRSFCSSIANNQMIWGGRCPVSIKYNKELIKWFWFVWCAVMGVGWMVESGTVSLAFKWQLLEFLIFGV